MSSCPCGVDEEDCQYPECPDLDEDDGFAEMAWVNEGGFDFYEEARGG